jgi:hypothetical protein
MYSVVVPRGLAINSASTFHLAKKSLLAEWGFTYQKDRWSSNHFFRWVPHQYRADGSHPSIKCSANCFTTGLCIFDKVYLCDIDPSIDCRDCGMNPVHNLSLIHPTCISCGPRNELLYLKNGELISKPMTREEKARVDAQRIIKWGIPYNRDEEYYAQRPHLKGKPIGSVKYGVPYARTEQWFHDEMYLKEKWGE